MCPLCVMAKIPDCGSLVSEFELELHYYVYFRTNVCGVYRCLVGFYGISTIVGYLIPSPLYTYILNIYDLVGLGFMVYQPF